MAAAAAATTTTTSASILLHLLFLSLTILPLSSTSAIHHRRILHQPFLPLDSSPPPTPSPPAPLKYPFTPSTPDGSPFFPSYPSPPSPPSPASLATFPANISSLAVPSPSKSNSASSKLIVAAVAAVIAAVAVVSLAVFLHLRKRTTDHGSSSIYESKTQGSDICSTVSFSQTPNTRHIPKLQRPSQTSSEFLYLGTLVNAHAPGSGAPFNGTAAGAISYNSASNTRKLDSPELRPLPPLNIQQGFRQNSRNNAEVVSSRDDESEKFYSPKGSINGRDSSIGAGSASRRTFAAMEVENFNGSTSDSLSTCSSTVPGSGSGSPLRSVSLSLSPANNLSRTNSMPKSPDLIEIQAVAPLHPQTLSAPEMTDSLLQESASPSPPSSSSPERYSRRSEESSPRISNSSDQNVESPVRCSSPAHDNITITPTPPELGDLVLPESASPLPHSLPSPERYLNESVESSPRNSNALDQSVECPVRICSPIRDMPLSSSSPERRSCVESPPRKSNFSDQYVESPERSEQHHSIDSPTVPEMQALLLPGFALQSPPGSTYSKSEESSPRNSSVQDENVESPVRISSPSLNNSINISKSSGMLASEISEFAPPYSPGSSSPVKKEESSHRVSNASDHQNTIFTSIPFEIKDVELFSPETFSRSEETSPRISNASDQNAAASPVRISISELHNLPNPCSEELSSTILNDFEQNVESLLIDGNFIQNNATIIPPPPPPPPPVSFIPPPPPPPPPPSKAWLSPKTPTPPAKRPTEPPALKNPLKPISFESPPLISPIQLPSKDSQAIKNDGDEEFSKETEYFSENVDSNGESSPPKPKLKPLHWDKVRASSYREMVWDQLKCSSFELNEEMIETLFVVNTPKPNPKEATRWQVLPSPGQDNGDRVLDPKKAQNIAILLKAVHVTVDEVCEGLLEGNADILGTELLESLLKMAPTKEEELKLKEYKDDSPVKLGPAERFLKAVVNIPHAFKRLEAMLYVSNFESEIEFLKNSFATLEAACEELRMSRMFLKLLEAVLKTGNRMNVGTNRGDAHAFKLDTLLKLVDVKGADGKTTLLHFVVQEIIRSEGARQSGAESSSINDDAKCRKLGLQVVSALSSELSNVKKAAVMDAEMLSTDICKLYKGIGNVREIVKLNEGISSLESCSHKFSESMNSFIERAEEEIFRIQAQENLALSLVKEITEYFHGNSAKEEAHPFRIFMVVRDFLTSLDRVCKEVGMINERTMVSSAHKFPVPVNPMLQQVPAGFLKRQGTSSNDESLLPLNL